MKLLKRFYTINEAFRLIFMVGMIVLLFYPDFSALKTMAYVLGVFLVIALISHITRKYCLFNYLNMKTLADSAVNEKNVASAIVFASVCAVIVACIVTAAKFFVR